jgi:hypothetical protein
VSSESSALLRRRLIDEPAFPVFFVLELDFERFPLVLELHRGDFPVWQFLGDQRLVAVATVVGGARVDQFHGQEGQHHHDQDRECGALEETAHERCPGCCGAASGLEATGPLAYHGNPCILGAAGP